MASQFAFWGFMAICVISFSIAHIVTTRIKANERTGHSEADTRTTQEIYKSLEQMQRRIEALETLLIENEKHARAEKIAAEIERL